MQTLTARTANCGMEINLWWPQVVVTLNISVEFHEILTKNKVIVRITSWERQSLMPRADNTATIFCFITHLYSL